MARFACFFLFILASHQFMADPGQMVVSGRAQGTTYRVKYYDGQRRNFKRSIDSLLADFDKSLSLYRADSEISVFNRSHAIRFTSPYFYPVLKKAGEVNAATQGLFDPTVLPLVEAYGFGPAGRKNEAFDLDSVMRFVGFSNIEFDSVSVRKSKEGVKLDFNALAQGYSVDVIAHFLESNDIHQYLVEVGGELRGKGTKPEGAPWIVGIANPEAPDMLAATVRIADRAMATSGNYRNHYRKNGITFTHIVDPVTGLPGLSDILSVTVFAPDAMTADAYATAFLLMGIEKLKERLGDFPGTDVYVTYSLPDGEKGTFVSEGLQPFVSGTEK
ncbi:FAD:protein FMN transferase [Ravibacter arvi]|uniref:FAD:protein FMN transferase n=1 Tax=Ravibacter arvi TaxID=2051041 RepID=A0ABP8LYS9_9BACT